VLVAGGGNTNSAELYDPQNDTWSATAHPMIANRNSHTATPLASGKVLISGGINSITGNEHSSAELYDPALGTWSATGSMSTVRQSHAATLLADGSVLVTGGFWRNSFLGNAYHDFAELYNPTTEVWSIAGLMTTPRAYHSAALLTNGDVLVVGGTSDGTSVLANSEIFHIYTITTSAGTGGSITPTQTVVRSTDSIPVVVTPDSGYLISDVTIDGISQTYSDPQLFSQTFPAVTANHTVSATFVKSWPLTIGLIITDGAVGWVTDGGSYICNANPCPSLTYADTSKATLNEFADSNSFFTGWSIQACGSSTTCEVNMTVAQSVSAGFDRLKWAKIETRTPPYYGKLTNAYKDVTGGDVIKAQTNTFSENLLFGDPVYVTLDGGYADASFTGTPSGYTTVHGTMTISKGKVTVKRVKIR
jgi:hypothetical protein